MTTRRSIAKALVGLSTIRRNGVTHLVFARHFVLLGIPATVDWAVSGLCGISIISVPTR
jgi:hypothetical protein